MPEASGVGCRANGLGAESRPLSAASTLGVAAALNSPTLSPESGEMRIAVGESLALRGRHRLVLVAT